MNIYAIKGHKVRCCTLNGGYDSDKEKANKYLNVSEEYTIEKTVVDNWHTDVYLEEFPNVKFNSVFFEDVTNQSEELDKQHLDYFRYHGR